MGASGHVCELSGAVWPKLKVRDSAIAIVVRTFLALFEAGDQKRLCLNQSVYGYIILPLGWAGDPHLFWGEMGLNNWEKICENKLIG